MSTMPGNRITAFKKRITDSPKPVEAAARTLLEHVPSIALRVDAQAGEADATKPVWIQIAKPGKFRGHSAGHFEMNAKTFAEIIANFKAQENREIPVDFEHASEQPAHSGSIPHLGAPAQGWVGRLELRADGNLWGLCTWGDTAKKYIKAKQYRYLSPAIVFGAKDRVTGKPIGARLSSVALTNSPFLDGMQPVAAKRTETENTTTETEMDPALVALTAVDADGNPQWQSVMLSMQADLDAVTMRATTSETALEAANTELAVFRENEIATMVDQALSVWGMKRGLTMTDRPALLEHARLNKENFSALYPRPIPGAPPPPSTTLLAAGPHVVAPNTLEADATRMGNAPPDPELPTHEELAATIIENAKTKGIVMSREEGFSRAFTERRTLAAAARRQP